MNMIQQHLDDFQLYTDNFFQSLPQAAGLYDPFSYSFASGGKRLRPLLCMESCAAAGGDIQNALPAALALELFHNFSLMHDDIMDEASVRRGRASVPAKYGRDIAILSGDVMLVHAYEQLQKSLRPESLSEGFRIFSAMGRAVCEGQMMDMDFESRRSVGQEEYIEMISKKTSALLACCLELGALTASMELTTARKMYTAGYHAGIAFQILDDYLDTYGEHAKVGKRIGGDILQGKKTILYILCRDAATNADREMFFSLMESQTLGEEEKIAAVMEMYEKYGVKKAASVIIEQYWKKSELILEEIGFSGTTLHSILLKLVQRDY